jgi:hypothetical protein
MEERELKEFLTLLRSGCELTGEIREKLATALDELYEIQEWSGARDPHNLDDWS